MLLWPNGKRLRSQNAGKVCVRIAGGAPDSLRVPDSSIVEHRADNLATVERNHLWGPIQSLSSVRRAPLLQCGGGWSKTSSDYQFKRPAAIASHKRLSSSVVERESEELRVGGAIPSLSTNIADLAQLVEHPPCKWVAVGSTPTISTSKEGESQWLWQSGCKPDPFGGEVRFLPSSTNPL